MRMHISDLVFELGEGAHVVLRQVVCTKVAALKGEIKKFSGCVTTFITMP